MIPDDFLYFRCFCISIMITSFSGNFNFRGGPFFSPDHKSTSGLK